MASQFADQQQRLEEQQVKIDQLMATLERMDRQIQSGVVGPQITPSWHDPNWYLHHSINKSPHKVESHILVADEHGKVVQQSRIYVHEAFPCHVYDKRGAYRVVNNAREREILLKNGYTPEPPEPAIMAAARDETIEELEAKLAKLKAEHE